MMHQMLLLSKQLHILTQAVYHFAILALCLLRAGHIRALQSGPGWLQTHIFYHQ
jgi:hypothetical protein